MSAEEALADLRDRADRAAGELRRQARAKAASPENNSAYVRLCAKATGVELVRSYIDDAIALSSSAGSPS